MSDFNALLWHDAAILEISIDRREPGVRDEICLRMRWPDDRRSRLVFTDCYRFTADMNFGIIADDTVLSARECDESDAILSLREKWEALGVNMEDLKVFEIVTNSTATRLVIVARAYVDVPDPTSED